MVDDSHATGFLGRAGGARPSSRRRRPRRHLHGHPRQSPGGGSGGFAADAREIVEYLRQRSRPYLFSNRCRRRSSEHARGVGDARRVGRASRPAQGQHPRFRGRSARPAFRSHRGSIRSLPSCSTTRFRPAAWPGLLNQGVYAIGFSFPVVPRGKAQIRTQLFSSAARRAATWPSLWRRSRQSSGKWTGG